VEAICPPPDFLDGAANGNGNAPPGATPPPRKLPLQQHQQHQQRASQQDSRGSPAQADAKVNNDDHEEEEEERDVLRDMKSRPDSSGVDIAGLNVEGGRQQQQQVEAFVAGRPPSKAWSNPQLCDHIRCFSNSFLYFVWSDNYSTTCQYSINQFSTISITHRL
jgi:hypothetical protein